MLCYNIPRPGPANVALQQRWRQFYHIKLAGVKHFLQKIFLWAFACRLKNTIAPGQHRREFFWYTAKHEPTISTVARCLANLAGTG